MMARETVLRPVRWALLLRACILAAAATAPAEDEVDELLREVKPPARFADYKPNFSVRKALFKWTAFKKAERREMPRAFEQKTIHDGERMIGYLYEFNPVFAQIRLFSLHPRHVAKINPEDWADATDFRNYARDYGEALTFGGQYDETNTEIQGGGEKITFVRTDICKPDGPHGRDSREVNTVSLSVHPQLGYCLDRTREWQVKPLPVDGRSQKPITRTSVGDLWGWGVVNPWPGEGTYTQSFFSHGASYCKGRDGTAWAPDKKYTYFWENGPSVEGIRHGYHPRVRPNGLVGYLNGREGWGVAMVVVGSPDIGAAVCPAWGEFHAGGPELPAQPDADGYWRSKFTHRMVGLPPEIQEYIRQNAKMLFEGSKCLAIRPDGEDFEEQPLPFNTPYRTMKFDGRGPKLTQERAHSGTQSIVVQGIQREGLANVNLHCEHPAVCFDPHHKYHLECWVYVEGADTEAFVIGANELLITDPRTFADEETVGKTRTPSVKKPGEWRKVTLEFTAAAWGGILSLNFVALGPGKAYFDDFRIVKLPKEAGP